MSLPSWPSSAGQTLIASAGGLDFKSLAEQYGKLTVREITSGSSGLAFAQLVAARRHVFAKIMSGLSGDSVGDSCGCKEVLPCGNGASWRKGESVSLPFQKG